ncbi:MAG: DUF4271 domain-containing protein [Paludibacteraceae bacterium]|nr:DUF4271 domain-containing protein [Paludibacteraceae bacterium]
MTSVVRIDSPYSQSWGAWVLVIIMGLLIVSIVFQRGIIRSAFQTLIVTKNRNSPFEDVLHSTYGQVSFFLYQWLLWSLAMYSFISLPQLRFSAVEYLICLSLALCAIIIRFLLDSLVNYVFFDNSTKYLLKRYVSALNTVFSVILLPLIMIVLYAPFVTVDGALITLAIFYGLYIILYIIKAFQLFFHKPMACLYIFSYLCTLELVPFVNVLFLTDFVIDFV